MKVRRLKRVLFPASSSWCVMIRFLRLCVCIIFFCIVYHFLRRAFYYVAEGFLIVFSTSFVCFCFTRKKPSPQFSQVWGGPFFENCVQKIFHCALGKVSWWEAEAQMTCFIMWQKITEYWERHGLMVAHFSATFNCCNSKDRSKKEGLAEYMHNARKAFRPSFWPICRQVSMLDLLV